MNSNINLVSSRNLAIEREQKILFALRATAVGLLSAIALLSIIAFIFSTQIPISKIKEEQTNTLSGITASSKKLSSYYLIKNRIDNINSLINTRQDYTKTIDLIFSKIPDSLSVESISMEKNLVEMEISGSSLVPINEAINSLLSLGKEKKIIQNVKLKSLSLNPQTSRYSVAFTAEATNGPK